MCAKSLDVKLCASCGSTSFLENYPAAGLSICTDCGRDVACVPLKVISENIEEELLCKNYVCPHCNSKDDSDDLLNDEGIVVLKCNVCGKLDGFRILPMTFVSDETLDDGYFDGKAVAMAKEEGHLIFSASTSVKLARAFKKQEKDPLALCQKSFERFLEEKSEKLIRLGLDARVVEMAKFRASQFIASKGPFTDKQLEYLLSGAIVLAQEEPFLKNKIVNKVSERKISELFNADRVTIRKWKKMIMENSRR